MHRKSTHIFIKFKTFLVLTAFALPAEGDPNSPNSNIQSAYLQPLSCNGASQLQSLRANDELTDSTARVLTKYNLIIENIPEAVQSLLF